jgi:membrane-associated protein
VAVGRDDILFLSRAALSRLDPDAAGDLVMWQTFGAAAGGAIAGDQVGYWAGRGFGSGLLARLRADPAREKLLSKAVTFMEQKGVVAVYLTRWLFSPLGPWVNLTAGSTGYGWPRFCLAGIAGEATWAGIYVGMGYAFAGNVEAASSLLGSVLGVVAGVAAVLILGYWLFTSQRSAPAPGL